jgi:hypothetical protein
MSGQEDFVISQGLNAPNAIVEIMQILTLQQ